MALARDVAKRAFLRAIDASHPGRLVPGALGDLAAPRRAVTVLAFGKAAVAMAEEVRGAWGDAILGGFVVTKAGSGARVPGFDVVEAAHPVPDRRSVAAARELLARAAASPEDGLALALISGGASALACAPAPGIAFDEKLAVTRALAAAGAPIFELNTVRKHLSAIKGGRLALAARGRRAAVILSDVVGDDPSTIGGGPMSPDPTTHADALDVIERYRVAMPDAVRARLESGVDDTPRLDIDVETHVIGGPASLVQACVESLRAEGVAIAAERRDVEGSVERLAAWLVGEVQAASRGGAGVRAVVAGGEPTIRLPAATGRGGRAQHAALVCARALERDPPPPGVDVAILCGASDGTDGPTGDAGGLVDAGTCARARAAGVDPDAALASYDAGRALEAAGDLVTTGPTGTNVCDLFVAAIVSRTPRRASRE